jgi:hypothetical protein
MSVSFYHFLFSSDTFLPSPILDGLAAAVWTRGTNEGHRIAREIDAGMVHINGATIVRFFLLFYFSYHLAHQVGSYSMTRLKFLTEAGKPLGAFP